MEAGLASLGLSSEQRNLNNLSGTLLIPEQAFHPRSEHSHTRRHKSRVLFKDRPAYKALYCPLFIYSLSTEVQRILLLGRRLLDIIRHIKRPVSVCIVDFYDALLIRLLSNVINIIL